MRKLFLILAGLTLMSAVVYGQKIDGEYVETRSADVYTGPCFSNSEFGLLGDQAILAWRINRGSWNGVNLDGLGVVGVAKASGTIGDQFSNPYPAKAVLIFDERATAEQRTALRAFVQSMAGDLLKDVVAEQSAPVAINVDYYGEHPKGAVVKAGDVAAIKARMLSDKDHFCGNEEIQYRPMAPTDHAMAGVAILDEFKGNGLGVTWALYGKRSAFIGHFAR